MQNLKQKYDGWALVTGASSGIGKAFVQQLAAQGYNLVLVARREEALAALAREVEDKHSIETRIVVADFAAEGAVAKVIDQTDDLDIGLLVPCAGIDEMGLFLDKHYSELERMMRINIDAPTQLCHAFGSKMANRSRSQKGHSGIILVSSLFAYQGIPHFATYAATKAYVLALGEALTVEMRGKGIDVLTLSPGLTATPFAQGLPMNLSLLPMIAQKPECVARTAMANLGRKGTVVSGLLNKFYAWENRLIPRSWPVKLFGFLIGNAAHSHQKHQGKTVKSNLA